MFQCVQVTKYHLLLSNSLLKNASPILPRLAKQMTPSLYTSPTRAESKPQPFVQWLPSDHLTTMNLTTEHLVGAVWVWASCLSGYLIQNKLQIITVSSACLQLSMIYMCACYGRGLTHSSILKWRLCSLGTEAVQRLPIIKINSWKWTKYSSFSHFKYTSYINIHCDCCMYEL